MGENIYENVMDTIELHEKLDAAVEERKDQAEEHFRQAQERILQAEELKARYRALAERTLRDGRRLVRAFPGIQSRRHKELLERIRERIRQER